LIHADVKRGLHLRREALHLREGGTQATLSKSAERQSEGQ